MPNQILAGAVINAGQVIAGVDASNPPYVGPPIPTYLMAVVRESDRTSGSLKGLERLYMYDVYNIEADPIVINNPNGSDYDQWGNYGDQFADGGAVVASNDEQLFIGAGYEDLGGLSNQGAVYVYNKSDLTTPITTITSPSPTDSGYFGKALAINDTHLFISENGDQTIFVYDLSDLSTPTAVISDTRPPAATQWNFAAHMLATNTHLVVGDDNYDNSNTNSYNHGSVSIYDLSDLSSPIHLTDADIDGAASWMGVKISNDETQFYIGVNVSYGDAPHYGQMQIRDITTGNLVSTINYPAPNSNYAAFASDIVETDDKIIVTAFLEKVGSDNQQGRVYVYDKSNLSSPSMILTAPLSNNTDQGSDRFGEAMVSDGDYLYVADRTSAGAGSIYQVWNATGAYIWRYDLSNLSASPYRITEPNVDRSEHVGQFARQLSVVQFKPKPYVAPPPPAESSVAEGTWTVVTSAQFGNNFNGQAFIMREGGNNTTLSTPATGNMVGSSVAVSEDYVFVGNSHYDQYGDNGGAVFVFDKNTGSMVRTLTGPGIGDHTGFGSVDMTVVTGGVNRVAVKSNKRAQIVGSPNESFGYGHIQIMDFDGGNVVEIPHPDFDVNQGYANMMEFGISTGWTPTKFISAMNKSDAGGKAESGSVFIFNHDGTLSTRLDGQNSGDRFGRDISTQSNHGRVLVGVSGWNNKAGKVQLFEDDGTEVFSIERPTTEAGAHGSAQPEFGKIVAYGSGRIAVGENLDTSVGRVHIFDEIDGSYINTVSLPRNDNPATGDIKIAGNYIFVSASGYNSNNGAFWVYDLDGNNGTRIDNIGSSGFAGFGQYLAPSIG